MGEDSVTLIPMPLYHSSGVTRLMVALSLGMKVVVMERFDALSALRLIEEHRVTHGVWVPTMLVRFLQLPEADRKRYDLSSQVRAIVGSGPCPVSVKERVIEWWGPILSESYGGTEGNGMTLIESEDWLRHKGSVGKPVFGVIHILDDGGAELAAGEQGVIYFEAGRQFEYHDDPEKTRSAHNDKGWSTLADVGYVTQDGYLYITDRKADMIISGGLNIYPLEVENLLTGHPLVRDVAVIGVPDEEFGESVKAVVIPIDPAAAGPELELELIDFCRSRLAHYKCPRSVDFVDDLPRQPTGKLYKRLLRDRYWAGRASRLV
jgi:acyl-CoA synthetase (AMP-forming)/AMP-acid ligase II